MKRIKFYLDLIVMNTRWQWVFVSVVLGLLMLGCGVLIPVHLRALDSSIVLSAGRTGDSLIERGNALADANRLGAAQIFVSAAHQAQMPGWDRLQESITARAAQSPGASYWGNDPVKNLFNSMPQGDSFSAFIVQRQNREAALAHLQASAIRGAQALMRCRSLERLTLFPPASSDGGQAYEAVIAECGLLMDETHLMPSLTGWIADQAEHAALGGGSQALEETLMDFGSLGEHFNWDQLTALVANVPDASTLHALAGQVSGAGDRLPLLFAAVQLSGEPSAVVNYIGKYPQTGFKDISSALWYGANGIKELTESGQRFYVSNVFHYLAAHSPVGGFYYFWAAVSLHDPWLVLAVKWLCYLGAGFFFAMALHFMRPPVSELETPLQVRGFHLLRELLFSLGFLLMVLLLSEPFLAQEDQKGTFSFRLHLPMTGGAVSAGVAGIKQTVMNPTIMLTLLVFFVLQALLYISCLVKLAEIRRQQVSPRIKLKLLENEDHLFDAGLYLGFVGTIVSLIVASLGLVKFSLMAAYSSTSFGIIFVVIFKIFHLRPARRKLLLEAELAEATATRTAPPAAVTQPAMAS